MYLSLSLSLLNFSRHALEPEAAHDSDLTLQHETNKKMRITSSKDKPSGLGRLIFRSLIIAIMLMFKRGVNAIRQGNLIPEQDNICNAIGFVIISS